MYGEELGLELSNTLQRGPPPSIFKRTSLVTGAVETGRTTSRPRGAVECLLGVLHGRVEDLVEALLGKALGRVHLELTHFLDSHTSVLGSTSKDRLENVTKVVSENGIC